MRYLSIYSCFISDGGCLTGERRALVSLVGEVGWGVHVDGNFTDAATWIRYITFHEAGSGEGGLFWHVSTTYY